jgi:hypothetical protein
MDNLDLYIASGIAAAPTLPHPFVTQLNLFAGQLYLGSFRDYVEVCTTLGLAWQMAEDGSTIAVGGFVIRDRNGQVTSASTTGASQRKWRDGEKNILQRRHDIWVEGRG